MKPVIFFLLSKSAPPLYDFCMILHDKNVFSLKITAGGQPHMLKRSFSPKNDRRRPLSHAKTEFFTKKNRRRPLSHAKMEFFTKKKPPEATFTCQKGLFHHKKPPEATLTRKNLGIIDNPNNP